MLLVLRTIYLESLGRRILIENGGKHNLGRSRTKYQ